MAYPSRRHRRRRARACLCCSPFTPLQAESDSEAVTALRASLAELGDPVMDSLECLTSEQFAALAWQLPQPSRTNFLNALGVPPAKRPTTVSAGWGLTKLRAWPTHKRYDAALFLTVSVVERLGTLWHHNADAGFLEAEEALRQALTKDPAQTAILRLALVCHGPVSPIMTIALRVGLDAALGLPGWPQKAVNDIMHACRELEQAIIDANETDDNEGGAAPYGDDEVDDGGSIEPAGIETFRPPGLGNESIAKGSDIMPAEPGTSMPAGDVAAAATNLTTRHTAAREAAEALTDVLHRGQIPGRTDLDPVIEFFDAADAARDLLTQLGRDIPADVTVEDLLTALTATAGQRGHHDRLADISRLTGPTSEQVRITAAIQLAADLQQNSLWDADQQRQTAGLVALLDLIIASETKDMQALSAALTAFESHLPADLAALRTAAITGQLRITGPSEEEVSHTPVSEPAPQAAATGPETAVVASPEPQPTATEEPEPATAPQPVVTVPPPADEAFTDPAPLGEEQPATATDGSVVREDVTIEVPEDDPAGDDAGQGQADDTSSTDPAAGRELVRELLGAGRLSLTYHAATACGDRRRADALRVLTLATAVRSETSPTADALRVALEAEQGAAPSSDTTAQMLLLAGAVRACLVTADAGAGQVARSVAESLRELPAVSSIADTIGTATEKRLLYSPELLAALAPIAGADNDIAVTVEAAQTELNKPRNLAFDRADQIATLWWSPNGAIGRLLTLAATDQRIEIDAVTESLRLFAKRQYVDDLLDREDAEMRSGSTRPLQGRQRRKLKEMAGRSVAAVRAWADAVRVNQATAHGPVPAELARLRVDVIAQWPAAEDELQNLIASSAGTPWLLKAEAAQVCVTSLHGSVGLLDGRKLTGSDRDPDAVIYQELLLCPQLPFTAEGIPERPATIEEIAVAAFTGWSDAFAQRLRAEQYATAGLLISAVTEPEKSREMSQQLTAAAAQSLLELKALHHSVAEDVARATRLGQLDENAGTAVTSVLAAGDVSRLAAASEQVNLSDYRRRLIDVQEQLPMYRHEAQAALRRRADSEVPPGADRSQRLNQIQDRIAAGDLATAEEYLLAAVLGETLPSAEPSEDLTRFLRLTERVPGGLTRDLIDAVRYGKPHPALDVHELTPAQRTTADLLQTWLDMRDIRHDRVQRSSLAAALLLAGIEFASMQPVRDMKPKGSSRRAWWDLTDVRRVGETQGVPQYSPPPGGQQRIMLCWGEPDVRAMFGWIDQDPGTDLPVIVLLFAAMTTGQREELARMCAQHSEKPVIVIDDIAILHLALHGSGQFITTARTLLPFAATNPYAPDGQAALPLEMFFGRRSERADIIDPNGPNLLYGGRQLGKTALLQEAARAFGRVPTNLPIYVTLPNVIGTKVNPLTLWDKLAEKLTENKIALPKRTRDPVKDVIAAISTWLDQNPARRMLLLIDECDGFFDADAERGFEHVTHLRNLRDKYPGRRFKPVFAGLHQVQRFANLPNQPLANAHLGDQVAIGPLSPEPAYQLLFTPMEALGIRFASDELVHRVLAYCTYQPKLLQMAGKALVSSVLNRRDGGPVYLIDENLLDQVLGSESLKQRIRQTVHLTLDLDSRYKLIALVVAYFALENGADHTMTTSQLRNECHRWWPAGFARQEPGEFRSLLDEMRELGVLAATAGGTRWRLRSTNVLRLLGTADEIWEELCSSQWRKTPTKLSTEQARGHLTDGRISPCTDQQLSKVVTRTAGSTIRVIAGARATAVDRVQELLEQSRKSFGARFDLTVTTRPQAYGKALRDGDIGGRHHVVLSPLLTAKPETVTSTIVNAMQIQPASGTTRTVAVLVDVQASGILDLLTSPDLGLGSDDVIALRRATDIGLRTWLSDNERMKVFTDATSQVQLMTATGGWPYLLDLAAEKAREHTSTRKICEQVAAYLATVDGATEFVDSTGLSTDIGAEAAFQALLEYAAPVAYDEMIELCALTGSQPDRTARTLQMLDVIDQSDVDGRWVPEPVIARSWQRLNSGA